MISSLPVAPFLAGVLGGFTGFGISVVLVPLLPTTPPPWWS